MTEKELQEVLMELSVLTNGQPHISEFLVELNEASVHNPKAVQSMVSDLRLWGGMGSVADQAGMDLPPEKQQRVHELLIRLYELLEHQGITDARGASWVETFRHWRNLRLPEVRSS